MKKKRKIHIYNIIWINATEYYEDRKEYIFHVNEVAYRLNAKCSLVCNENGAAASTLCFLWLEIRDFPEFWLWIIVKYMLRFYFSTLMNIIEGQHSKRHILLQIHARISSSCFVIWNAMLCLCPSTHV